VYSNDRYSDHVHPIGFEDDETPVRTCDFPFDQVCADLDGEPAEDLVTFSDMSAALALIIQWVCGDSKKRTTDVRIVAARALCLMQWLCPEQSQYENMADVAKACGCTRAALSKSLLSLKDQTGCLLSSGKGFFTRATFSKAQHRAVDGGTHSSYSRTKTADAGRV
jgi:hypothetical protein